MRFTESRTTHEDEEITRQNVIIVYLMMTFSATITPTYGTNYI